MIDYDNAIKICQPPTAEQIKSEIKRTKRLNKKAKLLGLALNLFAVALPVLLSYYHNPFVSIQVAHEYLYSTWLALGQPRFLSALFAVFMTVWNLGLLCLLCLFYIKAYLGLRKKLVTLSWQQHNEGSTPPSSLKDSLFNQEAYNYIGAVVKMDRPFTKGEINRLEAMK